MVGRRDGKESPLSAEAALEFVAHKSAVWRADLDVLLRNELAILCRLKGVSSGREVAEVRNSLIEALTSAIDALDPPRDELDADNRRYHTALYVQFGLLDDAVIRKLNITQRRRWLARHKSRGVQVAERTAIRWYEDAVNEIGAPLNRGQAASECQIPIKAVATSSPQSLSSPDPTSLIEKPTPKPPTRPKRPLILAASIAVVALAISAFIFWPKPTSPAGENAAPSVTPSNTENPLGTELAINVQTVTDLAQASSIAIPTNLSDKATPLVQTDSLEDSRELMDDAVSAGAFYVGGVRMDVKLEPKNGKNLTVYKVRPIHQREAAITGTAIYGTTQGENKDQIAFVLDSPAPVAQLTDGHGKLLGPYFNQQTIPVTPNTSPSLTLTFRADQAAYSFTVEIEYSMEGKNYSQTFDNHGQPFRATADLCMTETRRLSVPASEASRLSKLRYQAVRAVEVTPDGSSFQYVSKDPDAFARDCLNN